MKNVLILTDFSENAWNAMLYAIDYFKDMPKVFYVLHVSSMGSMPLQESPYAKTQIGIEQSYTKPAKVQLNQLIERIKQERPECKIHEFYALSDYNFLTDAVRRHVADKKIDLIIMGTKGASGLKKIIIGSNASDVITRVQCSTLVVPENAKFNGLDEIAFPTDFSMLHGVKILHPISNILKNYTSNLRVLHISKRNDLLDDNQLKNKELLEDYFSNDAHSFHFLINRKISDAIQEFVHTRNIKMIVMVARNLNYFQQILFHTKVEEISYHTDIPFMVIHE